MKRDCLSHSLFFILIGVVLLNACNSSQVEVEKSNPQTAVAKSETQTTNVPTPTDTPPATSTPTATSTLTPEPTPIPGVQVYPVSSLDASVPWLPLNKSERPMSVYYGFNLEKPPFNNILVRQAFAAAIDREKIAQAATDYKFRNVVPATSLTPPQVLGRDLYEQVGIPFDPARGRELLQQAGYSSTDSFPPVTLVVYMRGEASPGAFYQMAKMTALMWKENLGVTVSVDAVGKPKDLFSRMKTNPPEIYQVAWGADYVDPNNFLNELFHSGNQWNIGNFNNSQFDSLVDKAGSISNPAERQLLYIEAEKILTDEEAGALPLFHTLYYEQP